MIAAKKALLAVGVLAMLAGCANRETEEALAAARQSHAAIANAPEVRQYAPKDLLRAGETLTQAERFAGYWGSAEDARHYAYLSQRYAEIARLNADLPALQARAARLERTQERLEFALHELHTRGMMAGRSLEEQMLGLATSETERGLVMTLGDVLFEPGSAQLGPSANRTLLKLAQFLRMNPARRVRIEGYTDNRGSVELNLALSTERAQSVGDLLVDLGIAESRLEVVGYGEGYPVAENASNRGRALNRRVEVLFSDENGVLGEPR